MATFVDLTIPAKDIIGSTFDARRAYVWIEANTPGSVIVVDGTNVRVGGRRENVGTDGTVTLAGLVATDSADNPETFEYRVTMVFTPKGAKSQQTIITSTFPLTATANLAAIPEAWDDITAPPSWRSAFRDEMEALVAEAEAARDAAVDLSNIDTPDELVATLLANPASATGAAATATLVTRDETLPAAGGYEVMRLDPDNATTAPWQIVTKAFANGGGKPPNQGVWIGFNAERYLQDGSGQDGALTWHLGMESGYENPDDDTFGPEFYLNYGTPDGTTIDVAQLRPFYFRLIEGDTNDADDKGVHALFDIGPSADGIFAIVPGYVDTNGTPIFQVTKDLIEMVAPDVVA
jgi:hypothetical protein